MTVCFLVWFALHDPDHWLCCSFCFVLEKQSTFSHKNQSHHSCWSKHTSKPTHYQPTVPYRSLLFGSDRSPLPRWSGTKHASWALKEKGTAETFPTSKQRGTRRDAGSAPHTVRSWRQPGCGAVPAGRGQPSLEVRGASKPHCLNAKGARQLIESSANLEVFLFVLTALRFLIHHHA